MTKKTQSNHNSQSELRKMLQGANENLPETVPETRENTGGHVAICVRFESDKSRKRRKFFGLISKRSKVKPNQCPITFDTRLKTDLSQQIALVLKTGS